MADETKVQVTTTTTVKEISYRGYPVMVEVAKYDDGGNRIKDTYASLSEMHGATERIDEAVGKIAGKLSSDDLKTINGKALAKSDDSSSIDADVEEIAQRLIDQYGAAIDEKLSTKIERDEVAEMIGESLKAGALKFEIAESLESISAPSSTVIYLVRSSESSDGDQYDEYVYIADSGKFERIGGTGTAAKVDLSDYYTKDETYSKTEIESLASGKSVTVDVDGKSTLDSKAATAGTYYFQNASDAPSGKIYKYGKFSDVRYPEGTLEVTSTKRGFKNVWEPTFAENVKFVREVETGDSNQRTSFTIDGTKNDELQAHPERYAKYSFDGKTLRINDGGQYQLSGRLNGNIVVNTTSTNPDCELVFVSTKGDAEGFSIYAADVGHAILFSTSNVDESGDPDAKFLITIPDETINTIFLKSNVDVETEADEKPDSYIGAIVAADKLTFDGVGTLAIVAKGYQTHCVNAKNIVIEGYLRMYLSGTHDGFHARHTFKMMNGYVVIDRVDVDAIVGDYANIYGGKLFINDWGLRSPAGWAAQAIDCISTYEDSNNVPGIWGSAEVHLSGVHAPARLNTGKGKGYLSDNMSELVHFFYDREWTFAPGTKLFIDEDDAKGAEQRVTPEQYELGKDSFKLKYESWYDKDNAEIARLVYNVDAGTSEFDSSFINTAEPSAYDHIVYTVTNIDGSTYEWHRSFKELYGNIKVTPLTISYCAGYVNDGLPVIHEQLLSSFLDITDEYGVQHEVLVLSAYNFQKVNEAQKKNIYDKPEYTISGYVDRPIIFIGFGVDENNNAVADDAYNAVSGPRIIFDGAYVTSTNYRTISYRTSKEGYSATITDKNIADSIDVFGYDSKWFDMADSQRTGIVYNKAIKNIDIRTGESMKPSYIVAEADDSLATVNSTTGKKISYDDMVPGTKYSAGTKIIHDGRLYNIEKDIASFTTDGTYDITSDYFDALPFSAIVSDNNIHINVDDPLYVSSRNKHGIVSEENKDIEIKGKDLYLSDIGSAGIKGVNKNNEFDLIGKDYSRMHIYADNVGKVMQFGKSDKHGSFYGIDFEVIASNYDHYLYTTCVPYINKKSSEESSNSGIFCAFYSVPGADGQQTGSEFCTGPTTDEYMITETKLINGMQNGIGAWAALKHNDDAAFGLNLTNVEEHCEFPSDILYPWQQYNTADYTYDAVNALNETIAGLSTQIEKYAVVEDLLATQLYYDYPQITFTVADTLTRFVVKKGNRPDVGEPERADMDTFGKNVVVAYNKDGEGYDKGDELDDEGNSDSTAQFNCVVKASSGEMVVAIATPTDGNADDKYYNKCTVVKDADTGMSWVSLTKVTGNITLSLSETKAYAVNVKNNTVLVIEDDNGNSIAAEANALTDFVFKVVHNLGKKTGGHGYVSGLTIGGVESLDKLVCTDAGKKKDTYTISKDYITGPIYITITEPGA